MQADRDVADTIETLAERLQTSTLVEDRRDACRALKSLSKNYRVEVCTQAMDALIQVVKDDRLHTEMLLYCLESLNYIISGPIADSPAATWPEPQFQQQHHSSSSTTITTTTSTSSAISPSNDPGRELSEIFLKKSSNVKVIIDAIQDDDFKVRWASLRLLCGLARHQIKTFQESILSVEQSILPLAELISDEQELIRNDALVLFVWLTPNNQYIQNLASYCNCFDKIMYIIQLENYLSGTVAVVMDCLNILLNLLQNNESNQILFKEAGHIQKLLPFFNNIKDCQWTNEKVNCIVTVLQVIDTMIQQSNSPIHVQSCQDVMLRMGLLDRLCELLTAQAMPIGVLSETMNTASDIIRGHLGSNLNIVMSTNSMVPVLLLSMVKEMSFVQEKRISDLHSYVHLLYERLSSLSRPN